MDVVAAAQGQVDQEPQLREHLEAAGRQQRAVAATEQTRLSNSARALRKAREGQALTLGPGSEGWDTSAPTPSHLEHISHTCQASGPEPDPSSPQAEPTQHPIIATATTRRRASGSTTMKVLMETSPL